MKNINDLAKEEIEYDVVGIIKGLIYDLSGKRINRYARKEEIASRLMPYYEEEKIEKAIINLKEKNILTTRNKNEYELTSFIETISTKVIDPYWVDRSDADKYLYTVRNNFSPRATQEDWNILRSLFEDAFKANNQDNNKFWIPYKDAFLKHGADTTKDFEIFIEKFQETKIKIVESEFYNPPQSSTIEVLKFLKSFWILIIPTLKPLDYAKRLYNSLSKIYVQSKNRNLTEFDFIQELLNEQKDDGLLKQKNEILLYLDILGLINVYGNETTKYIQIVINKKDSFADWKKHFLKYYFNPYYNCHPSEEQIENLENSMGAILNSGAILNDQSIISEFPTEIGDSLNRFKKNNPNPNNTFF